MNENILDQFRTPRIAIQIFSVLGIAIGHILDGTVLAYLSPALPSMLGHPLGHQEGLNLTQGHTQFTLDPSLVNYVRESAVDSKWRRANSKSSFPFSGSFHSIGATLACLLAGSAMGRLGRRGTTLYVTIPAYALGYVLIGSAGNGIQIVAGRFLTGVGLGLTLSVPTVYIVEVTSQETRGVMGVVPNLLCQIGVFGTYVAGHWLNWSHLAYACECN